MTLIKMHNIYCTFISCHCFPYRSYYEATHMINANIPAYIPTRHTMLFACLPIAFLLVIFLLLYYRSHKIYKSHRLYGGYHNDIPRFFLILNRIYIYIYKTAAKIKKKYEKKDKQCIKIVLSNDCSNDKYTIIHLHKIFT